MDEIKNFNKEDFCWHSSDKLNIEGYMLILLIFM